MSHEIKDLNDREAVVVLKALANDLDMPARSWTMEKSKENIQKFQSKLEKIRSLSVSLIEVCDRERQAERTRQRNNY